MWGDRYPFSKTAVTRQIAFRCGRPYDQLPIGFVSQSMTTSRSTSSAPLRVVVVLALVSITFHWVNNFWYFETRGLFDKLGECWSYPASQVVLGLALTVWAPGAFGLRWGRTRSEVRTVALYAVAMIGVCAVVMLFVRTPFYGGCVAIYVVVPLAEELLFRGFLFASTEQAFPRRLSGFGRSISVATILTAVAFSAWHLGGLTMPQGFIWFQLVYTFVAGFLWGILRERTGSIWSGWLIHAAINACAVHVPTVFAAA